MSETRKFDVTCTRGEGTFVTWICERDTLTPAFWIQLEQEPRSELELQSIVVGLTEQLRRPPVPAFLFALEKVSRVLATSMRDGVHMKIHFRTSRAEPEYFAVWFGEREDVQKIADEIGVKTPF